MADKNEKDTKTGRADASSKHKAQEGWFATIINRVSKDALDKGVKWTAEKAAKALYDKLSPELRGLIREHDWAVHTVEQAVRAFLDQDRSVVERNVDEWIGDFVRNLRRLVEKDETEETTAPDSTAKRSTTPLNEAKEVRRIMLTVAALPDQAKRDQVNHWFTGLNSKPDLRRTFLALAATSNDNVLKALVQMPTPELETLLAALPPAQQEKKPMTILELRAAVAADADLKTRVQDFLTAFGADNAPKFWGAVERELNKRIRSLEEFQQLMSLSPAEIKQFLGLDGKSVSERLSGLDTSFSADVEASGAVGLAKGFRDRMKGLGDRLQAQLKSKPATTEGGAR